MLSMFAGGADEVRDDDAEKFISVEELEAHLLSSSKVWAKSRLEYAIRRIVGGQLGKAPQPRAPRDRLEDVLKYLNRGEAVRAELECLWNTDASWDFEVPMEKGRLHHGAQSEVDQSFWFVRADKLREIARKYGFDDVPDEEAKIQMLESEGASESGELQQLVKRRQQREQLCKSLASELKHQDIRQKRNDWLSKRSLSYLDALQGLYADAYLAVSHRWDDDQEGGVLDNKTGLLPDPTGLQLYEIMCYLVNDERGLCVLWVWCDFWCMPQGPVRTDEEQIEFDTMLPESESSEPPGTRSTTADIPPSIPEHDSQHRVPGFEGAYTV